MLSAQQARKLAHLLDSRRLGGHVDERAALPVGIPHRFVERDLDRQVEVVQDRPSAAGQGDPLELEERRRAQTAAAASWG